MDRSTHVHAEAGSQNIIVTREFELPVHLLFAAYTEAAFLEEWMGTRVLKLESRSHGAYAFETRDPAGNVVFRANGVIHLVETDRRIVRTFEMENGPLGPQLEFLDFEAVGPSHSRLRMQIVFRSAALRDEQLRMPFAYGLNLAHDRLQQAGMNRADTALKTKSVYTQ